MSRRVDSFWTGVLGTDAGTGTSVGFCFGRGLVGRETEAAVVEGPGPPVISASSSSSSSSLVGAVTGAGAAEVDEEAARLEGTNGAALELRRDLMGLADGGALDMLGGGGVGGGKKEQLVVVEEKRSWLPVSRASTFSRALTEPACCPGSSPSERARLFLIRNNDPCPNP